MPSRRSSASKLRASRLPPSTARARKSSRMQSDPALREKPWAWGDLRGFSPLHTLVTIASQAWGLDGIGDRDVTMIGLSRGLGRFILGAGALAACTGVALAQTALD